MMNFKQLLLPTMVISLCGALAGCGGGDEDLPITPPKTEAPFSARDAARVSASTIERPRSYNVRRGFGVPPFSARQQIAVDAVLRETNALRAEKGLPPLKYDPALSAYAQVRAHEIRDNYSHTRPNGTESVKGLDRGNGWSGENIYASPSTAKKAVAGWEKSKEHYDNMVKAEYDRIGIGFYYDPNSKYEYHWVQIFAGGDKTTRYYFDDSLTPEEFDVPDIVPLVSSNVELDESGKVSLLPAPVVVNNAAKATQAGELSHDIYRNANQYKKGDYQAAIQNPAGSDFSYQTFGEVTDYSGRPVQYLNVGQATVPNDDVSFSARYQGASLGNFNQESHVYADVYADVDFGEEKVMDVYFNNSQIALHDIADQNPAQSLTRAEDLDFHERLNWNSGQGRFNGATTYAQFYGANGEEMGGQFKRRVNDGHYEGVFGLRKQ